MGTEAAWVPLVAAAIGTGVSVNESRKVAKRQDNIAAEGIRKQAENQRQVNARLNQTLQQMDESDPSAERNNMLQSYMEQINNSRARANAGLAQRGISEQFDEMAGQAQGQATDYAGQIANLMSRIDAGALQRQREGNQMADMGMDLGVIGGNVRGDDHLMRLRLGGVRRSPYADAASGILSGYASSYGAKGGG